MSITISEAERVAFAREAARVAIGRSVKITVSRGKNKPYDGQVGAVAWLGYNAFGAHYPNGYKQRSNTPDRAGVDMPDGVRIFIDTRNLTVVGETS